ncbi:ABC transporter permease [Guptibacillus hwajinpoensis]|uniref:ABC-2 type transport system permease protein n=1 Tax=Guptibacillus hwajinpoensis TaxID=208199 RepID=A0ABU0K5P0_9BACL|nr:ABC transporter permease [Alkalihalobacillus hemicentroti]MDQ0484687.1 ABC-2 type transport system permease protein [Alkalihalobacillus hemicentroti]
MNKFFIVLTQTYINRLKSKAFIVTTVITLLMIFLLTNISTIIERFDKNEEDQVGVITTSEYFPLLQNQLERMESNLDLQSFEGTEEEAQQAIEEGELDSYMILEEDEAGEPRAIYKAETVAEQNTPQLLESALQQVKSTVAAERAGVTQKQLLEIDQPVQFEKVALEKGAKTEDELNQARVFVYVLLFVIYFSVIFYGNMVAVEVATEKSSRVMEILISSVSPVKQMFGKILGIALLGITQYTIIIISGYLFMQLQDDEGSQTGFLSFLNFSNLTVSLVVYAIVFFVLGYLLYATILAMVGSLVSRAEEVQQLIMPVQFLIIIAFFIAMFGLSTPSSPFVTIASYIPFFTPVVMFLRVGMLSIPFWEVAISLGLLIGSIIVFGILGAKVYRGGVLMYGKSSSLKDIGKALKLSRRER